MFDYLKFRAAAYKHKYDTAIKLSKKSVTYGDIMKTVSALSNALVNMGVGGRALVLMDSGADFVATCLALSKTGLETTVCCPDISKAELYMLCDRPYDIVFVSENTMLRLATTFKALSITCAVVDGNLQNVLPKEFEYKRLVRSNDYTVSAEPETTSGVKTFLDNGELSEYVESGILIDAPMWERAAATAVSGLLYEGGCISLAGDIDLKRFIRKNKIVSVLTTPNRKNTFLPLCAQVYTVNYPETSLVSGSRIFDTERMSAALTKYCDAPVNVYLSGVRVHIEITVSGAIDKKSPESHPPVALLKSIAPDIMCGTVCPKTFEVRQKSV